ncbi:MAG: glycosyltransferase family 4 protein, partial [Acidimicrobiales bacterium]
MRVLHVNKFGWGKGGSEIYLRRVTDALGSRGIAVGVFAGAPVEPAAGIAQYPVPIPDFHATRGVAGQAKAAAHVLWSRAMAAALAESLDDFQPDVVHLHLYAHQLSPSIVSLLQQRRVRTVMTAHDFKLVCPAYLAVRRGHDCFKCARHLSPVAARDRCLHDSLSWTVTALAEAALVRTRKLVADTVIAPSTFMLDALNGSWLRGVARLELLRNPAEPSGSVWHGDGRYLLYVGRLSPEKGVHGLIGQAHRAGRRLVIAGTGPEAESLEAHAAGLGADVTLVGHVGDARLAELRMGAAAQVVPSSWPENAPLAALEAAVDGVPLLVADRGGLREIIALGARGAVLADDNEQAFTAALAELADPAPPRD